MTRSQLIQNSYAGPLGLQHSQQTIHHKNRSFEDTINDNRENLFTKTNSTV